jgi:anti-sigma-K factor RskA
MDTDELHDLTAAYALDALDEHEVEAYEAHLATCAQCREELARFGPSVEALAYGGAQATPPAELRGRILEAARAERPNVTPLRPRSARAAYRALVAVAAVAACAAVSLGAWDLALHHRLDQATEALRGVPLQGATGSVLVGGDRRATLVVANLPAAPAGKTYEAWVLSGTSASPAGLFQGGAGATVVRLSHPVSKGATVAVTVEPAAGSGQPTRKPFIISAPV